MHTPPSIPFYPGLTVGVVCGVAAFALQGTESGVLWFVIGYFLGKSIQSAVWTLDGGRTA